MITPRLCAPAYELGECAEPVTGLPELVADPAIAAELTAPAAGFDTYRWSDAGITELMALAAGRTLAEARVPGGDIDMVLLATDSLPRDRTAHRDVAELLDETGIDRATVLTAGLMDCATAMVAVGTAASYVRDGTARNVLVVTGDLADRATGGQRVVAGGAAIASDAAASVLVSADAPGLPVRGMAHHSAPELNLGSGPQQQLLSRIRAHRELFARLADRCPSGLGTVRGVLPSNFARNVLRLYLSEVGLGGDVLSLGNVGRIGHCLGSDPLINLADRLAQDKDAPDGAGDDDSLVLFGAGVSHLAAVLLGARPLPRRAEGAS
ncbi:MULTISPECIES: acyl carrier protein [unclassified Streptomyces]|uniref:acyl carrier protein n=1 Tax=unclassified Streptomyces TaxID=2593676 RepID=UPI000DAD86B1|nr:MULTISPECIES: acyl carrier protein [unclassified Streptomyces]PZT76146.1 acyl carrier protein [Streptomyces sp. AC1-42W]PZT79901.1 acyl carrier protein [Streptomyces sp. AC1-42T]